MIEHAHCPCGCEHPQPVKMENGKEYCGACLIVEGYMCEMIPCAPATCSEE